MTESQLTTTRRSALAAATGSAALGLSGCLREIRSILNSGTGDRMELTIAVVPADDDRPLVSIANRLRDHLEAIGVVTTVDLLELSEFRLQVLFNHDFDIAIIRFPGQPEPDHLYSLLHSRFAPERGHQNPYGLTDHTIDSLLQEQRERSGDPREDAVADLLQIVAQVQPMTPICFPDEQRLIRRDRFEEVPEDPPTTSGDILSLDLADPTEELSIAIRDASATINLNPLSIEFRDRGAITGLLYDPLLMMTNTESLPWLASEIDWNGSTAELTIREATWHDGNPLTVDDVIFTYRFFEDTLDDDSDARAPVPRYRGRSSLVDSVDIVDERSVVFSFVTDRPVAQRALTIPILPKHIWEPRSEKATAGFLSSDETVSQALVSDNFPPIGSGPYRYESSTELEYLTFEATDNHFVETVEPLRPYRPPASFITFETVPNEGRILDGLNANDFALTLSGVYDTPPDEVSDELSVLSANGSDLVQVAYNLERSPLSNRNIRRIIARLIDKAAIVDEFFDGSARPTATPLSDSSWVPESLRWRGSDPEVPFFGSDGDLDESAAREAVYEAGFSYDAEGYIIGR